MDSVEACAPGRGDAIHVYTRWPMGRKEFYYVYCHPGHSCGIAMADGTPTPIYDALRLQSRVRGNRQRDAPLDSRRSTTRRGASGERSCRPTPRFASIRPCRRRRTITVRVRALCWLLRRGAESEPCAAVNLDYQDEAVLAIVGRTGLRRLMLRTADGRRRAARGRTELSTGGGKLIRI